jgi:phosphate transport system permease protein
MNFKLVAAETATRRAGSLAIGDWLFRALVYGSGLVLLAIMVLLIIELVDGAWLSFEEFGFDFFVTSRWDPVRGIFGALPLIYGTLVASIVALLIAVPISMGTAMFLAEFGPRWLRAPVSYLVEIIAAIPSVIIGLWGFFVLVPIMRDPVQKLLGDHLGFIPLFDGAPFGLGFLTAGLLLAIMIVPIITAVTRDVFLAVPNGQREAMLALGATRWEVISGAVIPYARSGMTGAVILGFGRALGETMAVLMVIGNKAQITSSLFDPAATIPSIIASEFAEATSKLYVSALIEAAIILLVISLIVNILARVLVGTLVRIPATVRE